jgi:hypothetical protein
MSSLQQYFEGKIVGSLINLLKFLYASKMQDFEGQRLVERIAYYAVIELAVGLPTFLSLREHFTH